MLTTRGTLLHRRYNGNDGELDAALQDWNALQAARQQRGENTAGSDEEDSSDGGAAATRQRGRRKSAMPAGHVSEARGAARRRRTTIAPGQVRAQHPLNFETMSRLPE